MFPRSAFLRPLFARTTAVLALLSLPAGSAFGQGAPASDPVATTVVIRAVSQDAKVIGDGVGGARITLRDPATGEVLAQGLQQGGTGDTDLIMRTPYERGARRYDTPGTAAFTAELMLARPTEVEIIAEGPLGHPQATQRASTTMLLVPGEDILGEGVILTIHGFIVTLLAPEEETFTGETLPVRARVTMACGCPTEPGGLWNAEDLRVVARLVGEGGAVVGEAPLRYAGETSVYEGVLPVTAAGPVELHVLATDAGKANAGRAWKEVVLQRR